MKVLQQATILCLLLVATFAEPPPSPLYGAPSNDLQAPTGGGDYSGTFGPIHVPSAHFEAPLPDISTLHDTYQPPAHRQRASYRQPQNTYGPPEDTYGPPPQISDTYGAPPQNTYISPKQTYAAPKQTYGPPPTTYLSPKPTKPVKTYVPPRVTTPRTVYIPPAPRTSYGPPAQQQQQRPNQLYGAPAVTGAVFPSTSYGPPSRDQPSSSYGAPGRDAGYNYGNGNGNGNGNDDYDNGADAKYEFEYAVKDDPALLDFGHKESRDGTRTEGRYYVLLPDGRKQIVTYYADETGYHPTITYEETGLGANGNGAGGYNYPGRGNGGNGNGGYSYNGY